MQQKLISQDDGSFSILNYSVWTSITRSAEGNILKLTLLTGGTIPGKPVKMF